MSDGDPHFSWKFFWFAFWTSSLIWPAMAAILWGWHYLRPGDFVPFL